ncbi:hypothetical protein MRB53_002354 [Persea americana]|uniref:Uncharacterized protein n=1 Tax=Persea americana TaxID=3435 RepID=A0ACC2MU90_PERAE|nr:hypothetical protein MRB53_002354 [Persea americana]
MSLLDKPAINFQKSGIYFSSNVLQEVRDLVSSILEVSHPLDTGRYLGLPSLIGRRKKAVFGFLRDRLWRKIQGWHGKLLSQAGREILLKNVAQAIPSYCMSMFLLPVSLCDELQKMMNSFWWGSSPASGKKIHWLSWDRLSSHKEFGGLGVRNLHGFNLAMLGKQAWKLASHPSSLVNRIFKAKDYP